MHIVANAINHLREETHMSLVIVSHYDRFFSLIEPQFTHVLIDGRIAVQGDGDLARKIDHDGYDWVYKEYNIEPPIQHKPRVSPRILGTCAVRKMTKGDKK